MGRKHLRAIAFKVPGDFLSRLRVEPLEDRRLLTATSYVDDDWVDLTSPGGTLAVNDLITNGNDTVNPASITATYGIDGFGKAANTSNMSVAGFGLIHDAIGATASGGTLNILQGNYVEPDFVIGNTLTINDAGHIQTSGTVNLTGAALNASVIGVTPTIGQLYSLIDNTGAAGVSGTFTGLPQGSKTTIGGLKYTINYSGGTGNDVTLTRVADIAPDVDLNGGSAGTNNTVTWSGASVTIAPAGTLFDSDDTQLIKITVTLSPSHTGDVLDANVTGTSITKSFSGGVLTLQGTDLLTNYQTVLRSVTYNSTNPAGPSGGSPVIANVVAFDFETTSPTRTATITVGEPPPLPRSWLFYNNSMFDDPGNGLSDDDAIANKVRYLPGGGHSSVNNMSSYSLGINGIIVDLPLGGTHSAITAGDFTFKLSGALDQGDGNFNSPGIWAAYGDTPAIVIRLGQGFSGSDRIELIFNDNTIKNTWLQVTVKANAHTGLVFDYHFYFASVPFDTFVGDDPDFLVVDVSDFLQVRSHPDDDTSDDVNNIYDFNKDWVVDVTDFLQARAHPTEVDAINIPSGGPFAPATGGATSLSSSGPDAGVSTALTLLAARSDTSVPHLTPWLVDRLRHVDLNSGVPARLFNHLTELNTPGARKIVVAADNVADDLNLDHTLLDSILAELGLP